MTVPSTSVAAAVNRSSWPVRPVSGPSSVTAGAWLSSAAAPLNASSSGTSSPIPQAAVAVGTDVRGSSSASREQ